jgi:acyl carrier protein
MKVNQVETPRPLEAISGTPSMPDPLTARLKKLIVDTLRLEDVSPADIPDDEPLVGGGLSLDSIDALELVVTLEREFGIKIASSEEARGALKSVESLAAFIRERGDPSRLPA